MSQSVCHKGFESKLRATGPKAANQVHRLGSILRKRGMAFSILGGGCHTAMPWHWQGKKKRPFLLEKKTHLLWTESWWVSEKRQMGEPGSGRRHWNSKRVVGHLRCHQNLPTRIAWHVHHHWGGEWSSASCKSLKNPLIRPARFPGKKRATLTKKSHYLDIMF